MSPFLFGSFVEHIEDCIDGGVFEAGSALSDEFGVRLDVLEVAKELGPTVLRFPGGTVMGIYHWADFVGPVETRKKVKNVVWGGKLCRAFGMAEFVKYCRDIGAEPMICINMPTGTPEEAANWVEYCNSTDDTHFANLRRAHGYEEPFNVKLWCIGNESYAEPDLGQQNRPEDYVRQAWDFARYMKMTDDSIKLVFVGTGEPECAWNDAVLRSMQRAGDYLSVHYYESASREDGSAYRALDRFFDGIDALHRRIEALYPENDFSMWNRFTPRDAPLKIAIDEWGIWRAERDERSRYGVIQTYDFHDALWFACFLNGMIRRADRIGLGAQAQMVNVLAPIMATKDGCYRQTIFYPLSHYRHAAGENSIACTVDGEGLDACATETNGVVTAFVVNRSARAVHLDVPGKVIECTALSSSDPRATNDMGRECVKIAAGDLALAPFSINIIKILL